MVAEGGFEPVKARFAGFVARFQCSKALLVFRDDLRLLRIGNCALRATDFTARFLVLVLVLEIEGRKIENDDEDEEKRSSRNVATGSAVSRRVSTTPERGA